MSSEEAPTIPVEQLPPAPAVFAEEAIPPPDPVENCEAAAAAMPVALLQETPPASDLVPISEAQIAALHGEASELPDPQIAAILHGGDGELPADPAKCTERDVLMGRGKRVSEWPGNIFFRQTVNRYRADYLAAGRNQKVGIANQVIEEVQAIGGRFLKEVNPASSTSDMDAADCIWVPVEQPRVVEKTCQALREKEKPTVSNKSPFVGDKVAEKLLEHYRERDRVRRLKEASGQPPRKRKYKSKSKAARLKDGETGVTSCDSAASADEGGGSKKKRGRKSSVNVVVEFSLTGMLQRLTKFQEAHGHMAVPTAWSDDVLLADWCTVQRQLHREVEAGFRCEYTEPPTKVAGQEEKATGGVVSKEQLAAKSAAMITKHQQNILDSLRKVDFCWDYEEWHWSHRYEQLVSANENSAIKVKLWLRQQRQLYRDGALSSERAEKLKDAGVILV